MRMKCMGLIIAAVLAAAACRLGKEPERRMRPRLTVSMQNSREAQDALLQAVEGMGATACGGLLVPGWKAKLLFASVRHVEEAVASEPALGVQLRNASSAHRSISALADLGGSSIYLNEPFFRQRHRRQLATLFHEFLHLLGWTDAELQRRLCKAGTANEDTECISAEVELGCPRLGVPERGRQQMLA